jgi:hypothetical protein
MRRNSTITTVLTVTIPAIGLILAGIGAHYGQSSQIDTMTARITSLEGSAIRSVDERATLMKQAEQNRLDIAGLKETITKEQTSRQAALVEVETQIDSLSQSTNTRVADLHRWISVVWGATKTLGNYPAGPHTEPNISNRHRTDQ